MNKDWKCPYTTRTDDVTIFGLHASLTNRTHISPHYLAVGAPNKTADTPIPQKSALFAVVSEGKQKSTQVKNI